MSFDANDIRYVCLSDLHFGEEDSLLTRLQVDEYRADPKRPSEVLEKLVDCLGHLISRNNSDDKPTLILNGDVLELAFASYGESLGVFERFLRLVLAPGHEMFGEVLFIPGNHDHHVWEIARETLYVTHVLQEHHEHGLPKPAHATRLESSAGVPSYLLNQIVRHVRHIAVDDKVDMPINVIYPNLALVHPERDRCVLIHHGHYVESLYQLISRLRRILMPDSAPPANVEELEAENFAWIDFVWSVLGRSGIAGAHAETLYKKLQYEENVEAFVEELADRVAEATDIPMVPTEWLERRVLRAIFSRVAKKALGPRHAKKQEERELADGTREYLADFGFKQMEEELGRVPADLDFVIGHTHKPSVGVLDEVAGRSVNVVNTGGWVVDSADSRGDNGASVALISGDLDVCSLLLYDDSQPGEADSISVRPANGGPTESQAFATEIANRIGLPEGLQTDIPFRELAVEIGKAVTVRRAFLRLRYRDGRG